MLAPSLRAVAAPSPAATGFRVSAPISKTLTDAQVKSAQKTATRGAVSTDKKTLTFAGKVVHLVVVTGPEDDMLSYRIAGLRNPTLSVPSGATLKILFVNSDEDMPHDMRFTAKKAPFPSRISPGDAVGGKVLPHRSEKTLHAEEFTVRVPAGKGRYAYVCTVPGHAAGGMYGAVVIR